MDLPTDEAPQGWLDRLLHPPPLVRIEAEVDACGQLTARAVARRAKERVQLRAHGELLAEGIGAAEWTGPLPAPDEGAANLTLLALAPTRSGPRSFVAAAVDASSIPAAIDIRVPAATSASQVVDFTFGAPGCAATEAATFAVHVDSGVVAEREGLVAAGEPVRWTWEAWEGPHTVAAAVKWRGWRLAFAREVVDVPVVPFDADGDGVVEGLDCDDHDVWSRPGLPEVPHDGRDNDCDGALAGDSDGDGYDRDAPRPTRLDAAARAALAALHPDADAEPRLLAAPRLREPDCADKDPRRHPWADEGDDTVDHDCDGGPGARGGAPIPGAEGPDPGPRPASAAWLPAGVPERLLVLDPGDVDVLAFLPRGRDNLRDLPLRVEVTGAPVWVELWHGGPRRQDEDGVVLGPLAAPTPALRWRVAPGAPLVLPAPAAKKEGTWTGALWRQVGKLWSRDEGPGPAGLVATAAALVWGTPLAVAVDLAEADARGSAIRRTEVGVDDVVYLRVSPATPDRGARVRVVLGDG